jgi:VIT1/CCC1 family predicted Fe2+/Mn2+ transporter
MGLETGHRRVQQVSALRESERDPLSVVVTARDDAAGLAAIRREWDPELSAATRKPEREKLYSAMRELIVNARPLHAGLTRGDVVGALAVFLLVCATTLPAVLPFLFVSNDWLALRISNFLLVALLFLAGYRWAAHIDRSPWLTGLALVALGLALVGVAIAFGG